MNDKILMDKSTLIRLLELIKSELTKYVKKEEGKNLSTEDFTTELLTKLNDIDMSKYLTAEETETLINTKLGDVESVLDNIIVTQEHYIGGDGQ